jgi:hypothetical protein
VMLPKIIAATSLLYFSTLVEVQRKTKARVEEVFEFIFMVCVPAQLYA